MLNNGDYISMQHEKTADGVSTSFRVNTAAGRAVARQCLKKAGCGSR